MTLPSLQFKGKFLDLKHLGFTFQRMFANNYRCWHRQFDFTKTYNGTLTVWIWQKGNEVEIEDWYHHSVAILHALLDDEKFPWVQRGGGPLRLWKAKDLVVDLDTNEVVILEKKKHDTMWILMKHEPKDGDLDEWYKNMPQEVEDEIKEAERRYRKIHLIEKHLAVAQFLLNNKLISLD